MNGVFKFVAGVVTGILVASLLVLAILFLPNNSNPTTKDLDITAGLELINGSRVKKAQFRASEVQFSSIDGTVYRVAIDSDTARETLHKAVIERNSKRPSEAIEVTEQAASSGSGWLFLIQSLPFLMIIASFFGGLAAVALFLRK